MITRAELQYGLKRLPAEHQLHLAVRQFLKIVRILPWDADAADWYGEIRRQLVGSGQDNVQWASILRSVSAHRSYRWVYKDHYRPWNIAEYLILNRQMPRSLARSTMRSYLVHVDCPLASV